MANALTPTGPSQPAPPATRVGQPAGANAAWFVFAGASGYALKGIFARLAYAEGLGIGHVVIARVALATPLFLLAAAWLAPLRGMQRRDVIKALALGVCFGVATLADFEAIRRLGAGPARVMLFTFPLYILVADAIRDRALPAAQQMVAFAVAWTGLALALTGGTLAATPDLMGLAIGTLTAVSYAFFLRVAEPTTRSMGSVRFAAISNLGTGAGLLLVGPFLVSEAPPVNVRVGAILVALVIVATVIPSILVYEGMRRAGAARAGLWSSVGPLVTLIVGHFALGEPLGPVRLLGAGLVIAGVALVKRAPAAPKPST